MTSFFTEFVKKYKSKNRATPIIKMKLMLNKVGLKPNTWGTAKVTQNMVLLMFTQLKKNTKDLLYW